MEIVTTSQGCIGREEILKILHRKVLGKGRRRKVPKFHKSITVLAGLAGIGKTFVVTKFLERLEKSPKNRVAWLRADTGWTLLADFLELTSILQCDPGGNSNLRETIHAFYTHISNAIQECGEPFIIIFDNAKPSLPTEEIRPSEEDSEGIKEEELDTEFFLPTPEFAATLPHFPSIIITSRYHSWAHGGKPVRIIALKQLTSREKQKYLQEKLRDYILPDSATKKLLQNLEKALQGYPLTLILGTAYLENAIFNSELKPPATGGIILKFLLRLDKSLHCLDSSRDIPYSKLNAKKERYDRALSFVWNTSISSLLQKEKSQWLHFYMATISIFFPFENWFRFTVPLEKLETFQLLRKFALIPQTNEGEVERDPEELFRPSGQGGYNLAMITVNSKHLSKQLVHLMQSDVLEHPEHVFINNHPLTWMYLDFCLKLHVGLRNRRWPGMGFRISNLFLLNLLVNATECEWKADRSGILSSVAKTVLWDLSSFESGMNLRERRRHAGDVTVTAMGTFLWKLMAWQKDVPLENRLEDDIRPLPGTFSGEETPGVSSEEAIFKLCLNSMLSFKDLALVQVFGAKIVHMLWVKRDIQFSEETLYKLRNWVIMVLVGAQDKFDNYYKYPWDKFAQIHRTGFKLAEVAPEILPLQTLFALYFQELDKTMNEDSPLAYRYWLILCGYLKEKKLFWNFPIQSHSYYPFEKPEGEMKDEIYAFVRENEGSDVTVYDDRSDLDVILADVHILNKDFPLQSKWERQKRQDFLGAGGSLMLIKGLILCVERKKCAYLMKIGEIIQELCRWEKCREKLGSSSEFLQALEEALESVIHENSSKIEQSAQVFLIGAVLALCIDDAVEPPMLEYFEKPLKNSFKLFGGNAKSPKAFTATLYITSHEARRICEKTLRRFMEMELFKLYRIVSPRKSFMDKSQLQPNYYYQLAAIILDVLQHSSPEK